MGMTDDGAQSILAQVLQVTPAFTALTKPFEVALFGTGTSTPADPGGLIASGPATVTGELRGNNTTVAGAPVNGYARAVVNVGANPWTDPVIESGSRIQTDNTGIITFAIATANWADGATLWVTGFVLYEGAASAGDRPLWHGMLDIGKPILNGDTASFAALALKLRLD